MNNDHLEYLITDNLDRQPKHVRASILTYLMQIIKTYENMFIKEVEDIYNLMLRKYVCENKMHKYIILLDLYERYITRKIFEDKFVKNMSDLHFKYYCGSKSILESEAYDRGVNVDLFREIEEIEKKLGIKNDKALKHLYKELDFDAHNRNHSINLLHTYNNYDFDRNINYTEYMYNFSESSLSEEEYFSENSLDESEDCYCGDYGICEICSNKLYL